MIIFRTLAIVLLAFVLLALGGCRRESSKESEASKKDKVEFQIGAELIEAPAKVAFDEKIVIAIHGVIGNNGASQFNRMETVESASKMEMTAIGTIDQSGQAVTQAIVSWRGREFTKNPPHVGPVKIVFNQPDGTTLEKIVEVNPR